MMYDRTKVRFSIDKKSPKVGGFKNGATLGAALVPGRLGQIRKTIQDAPDNEKYEHQKG